MASLVCVLKTTGEESTDVKNVLFVTTISGFLPQFEMNDVKILREQGCRIHYASNFRHPVYSIDEKKLTDEGIKLHHISVEKQPYKVFPNMKSIGQLIRIIDNEEIDMIHCHNPMGGVVARVAAVLSRRKPYVIYTAHGFHFYKGAAILNWLIYYNCERLMSRFTDVIITINKEDFQRAKKFRLKRGGEVFKIHSVGVDANRFCPRFEDKMEIRKELGIPQDGFHIVTAAELNENKNQSIVISAIERVNDSGIYYSICGRGRSEEKLKDLIAQKGLEDKVKLLGYRMDMERVLQSADCFAFPSRREGLGIAAVEALLCGVPLIVADNRGTREYAVNNKNSIICRVDCVSDFTAAIKLLKEDDEFRGLLARKAKESASEFTIDKVGESMKMIYLFALRRIEERKESAK